MNNNSQTLNDNEASEADLQDSLLKDFSFLTPMKETARSPWAMATKNIRSWLKKSCPGINFNVTSKRFSGGSSIEVSWKQTTLDENEHLTIKKSIDAIICHFATCSWSGILSSYEINMNNRSVLFRDLFGSAKYIRQRIIPLTEEEIAQKTAQSLSSSLSGSDPKYASKRSRM